MADKVSVNVHILRPAAALRITYRVMRRMGFERRDVNLMCAGMVMADGSLGQLGIGEADRGAVPLVGLARPDGRVDP